MCKWELFPGEMSIGIGGLCAVDFTPHFGGASSRLLRACLLFRLGPASFPTLRLGLTASAMLVLRPLTQTESHRWLAWVPSLERAPMALLSLHDYVGPFLLINLKSTWGSLTNTINSHLCA